MCDRPAPRAQARRHPILKFTAEYRLRILKRADACNAAAPLSGRKPLDTDEASRRRARRRRCVRASACPARRSIGGAGPRRRRRPGGPARRRRARWSLPNGEPSATRSQRAVCDQSPAEVYATLLEEQTYLCSPRTMYRVLAEADEVRERRDQVRHPVTSNPSSSRGRSGWDITKLKGPVPYLYYSLL